MRGADTFTESLFTMRRLEDFVPDNHPLRAVRKMVNLASNYLAVQLTMITCYLDSQDYSALTDPKMDTPARREIVETLLCFAQSKQVNFVFSAAAVSEVVALTPDAAHLAQLRAELLSDLCGFNALVSFDRLVVLEVEALAARSSSKLQVLDLRGRWFPDFSIDISSAGPWAKMSELAEEEMGAMGMSRQQRRAKLRGLFKNGKPRPDFQAQLNRQDPEMYAQELLKHYPMRDEHAHTIGRYALGRATEKEFNDALIDSLIDPRWMMRWFTTQHAMSSPLAELVRKPGRELSQLMRELAKTTNKWAARLKEMGRDTDPVSKAGEIAFQWQEFEMRQLLAVTKRIADANGIELDCYTAAEVEIHCAGITTGIKSLYSSVWANVGGGRKEEASDSQPVDVLHAFYAPYIRVFRADRFMAPHIQKHLKTTRTIVVPRLSQLVATLKAQLN